MSRPSSSTARLTIPLPVFLLLVATAGAIWWFGIRDDSKAPVKATDLIKTQPIEARLDALQQSWNDNNVADVRRFQLVDEDVAELGENEEPEPSYFDDSLEKLGWDGELPNIVSRSVDRTENIRYTVAFTLSGHTGTLLTYWEWAADNWHIATWQFPRK